MANGLTGELTAPRHSLSVAQRQLWIVEQIFPDSLNHVPIAYRLRGSLDIGAIRAALTELVTRHSVLRSCYCAEADGTASQVIRPAEQVAMPVTEIPGDSEQERVAAARELAGELSRIPFDLAAGPVIRVELLRMSADDHILLIVIHHIVADHWSLSILADELSRWYAVLRADAARETHRAQDDAAPALPACQYADYTAAQTAKLAGGAFDRHLAYWRGQLAGLTPPIIPGDYPRPAAQGFRGAQAILALPPGLVGRLRSFSREMRVTVFVIMLAGLNVLLSRYCDSDDVAIGCAMADRDTPEFERLIGCLINTVVLRTDLSGDPAFADLVDRVQQTVLDAYEHQDMPLDKLVEVLAPDRDPSHTPYLTVAVSYLSAPTSALRMPGLAVERFLFEFGILRFDLDIFISDDGDSVKVEAAYRTDLFDRPTVERMLDHYLRLLESAIRERSTPVSRLVLAGSSELDAVAQFGEKHVSRPAGSLVHERVAEHARTSPAAPAVTFGDHVLTYAELDERADHLARRLRRLGVGPEVLVGVCMERSAELVVAILGVLKAGGAYLPLDPDHPASRLAYMVSDSGVRVVVASCSPASAEIFKAAIICDPDGADPDGAESDPPANAENEMERAAAGPANLAYAIYTSGSSGQPKGVLIEHASLLNLCRWHNERYQVSPADRTAMVAAQSFDASVWELWPYLVAGACVCVADTPTRTDPEMLATWLSAQDATIMFAPTPLAEVLMTAEYASALPVRTLLTGGDALRQRPSADLGYEVVNHYGPTECTVVATAGTVAPAATAASAGAVSSPDIGRPIDNVRVRVLDAHMEPVPIGVVGELYLGGAGVARGYLNRPRLTAERFGCDPYGPPGSRLYRTGDLVRWRADGTLEFHGRNDRQIKIRGYRIEPAEIEARLCAHPDVTAATVTTATAGSAGAAGAAGAVGSGRREAARLAGYVTVRAGASPEPGQLRTWLYDQLPDYMVPETFTVLAAMPLTPNGKIDHCALPDPAAAGGNDAAPMMARTDSERRLAAIFDQVFERSMTGIDEDFFDLGGHSVLAVMLVGRIRREFGVKLPLRSVFRSPTVRRLSAEIDGLRQEPDSADVNRALLERLSAMPPANARALLDSVRGSGGGAERAVEVQSP